MYQQLEDIIVIDGRGFRERKYANNITVPMGQYQSVQKGPPKSNSMEIEVIDLESDSDTTVLSTTSDNPDGRNSSSHSSSSGEVPVVENRRQECNSTNRPQPQPLVQHSFERRNGEVIAVGDYLTRVATTTTTTVNSEEPVGDDVPMTGLITVAPTSKWAEPPSSDEGEEMEEGEITSDEEYGQEKQKKIPNQINPKNINLVMKQGNNVRVTSQGQGRTSSKECAAGTSSTRGDSSNQARMKSPVVTACLESPAAPVPDPEVAIMKEQNANLQKTIDSLKQELEQANQNCSISYVRGKEDGELDFQRKFKSANEEEILKMANGNAVNNSAVALLGHLLELRREKMAIVENTNAELVEKLKKMEGEKDEIFGLLCKSNGKLLSVTEEAVTLEQRVEELRALLVTKDAYIKTLGEDALVVSNAITRIHTTLQTYDSVAVVVSAAADESTPGNQSSVEEPATTTERSSSMVVESQCPPQNEAPVTLQEPTRNEDVRPTSSSKEKESSSQLPSLFQIPSLAPPVVSRAASKTSTRRTSPKSTRRISTRRRPSPPSRGRDRERGRERKDESHSVTQEERNRILKLLPGLENWQGYTIHDIIFKKYGWTCPQCGDQRRTLHATAAHARDKHVWVTCNRCWKRFPYGSPYAKHSKICSPRSTSSSHAPLTSLVKDE